MSKYCGNCGALINPEMAFCGSCGRHAEAPPTTAPPATTGGGSAGKIVLAVGVLLCLGVLAAVAGLYLAGRRIEEKASAAGFDIGSALQKATAAIKTEKTERGQADGSSSDIASGDGAVQTATDTPGASKDACALLTKEEGQVATGNPVDQVMPTSDGEGESKCTYTPGPGVIYPIELSVSWEHGKAAMTLLQSTGTKIVPGSQNGSGLGDASYFGPMDSGIWVLKDDKLFSLNFGLTQLSREKKVELADKVLSRLQ